MYRMPITRYMGFGTCLRYLQDVTTGNIIHGKAHVLKNIEYFLNCLEEFSLVVTQRCSVELYDIIDGLKGQPEGARLTRKQALTLRKLMKEIRTTLFAEAQGNIAFIVTDKRIDIRKLLSNVSGLFAPGVYRKLTLIAQKDFMSAGHCVAFGLPTAAAFHLLRGTEAVLRHFYCCIVKRKRVKPLNWGPVVRSLKARKKPPNETLLNNLDNIRSSFRNPTQHPEKCYDIDEAQDLFNLCIDVVNRMVGSKKWQLEGY